VGFTTITLPYQTAIALVLLFRRGKTKICEVGRQVSIFFVDSAIFVLDTGIVVGSRTQQFWELLAIRILCWGYNLRCWLGSDTAPIHHYIPTQSSLAYIAFRISDTRWDRELAAERILSKSDKGSWIYDFAKQYGKQNLRARGIECQSSSSSEREFSAQETEQRQQDRFSDLTDTRYWGPPRQLVPTSTLCRDLPPSELAARLRLGYHPDSSDCPLPSSLYHPHPDLWPPRVDPQDWRHEGNNSYPPPEFFASASASQQPPDNNWQPRDDIYPPTEVIAPILAAGFATPAAPSITTEVPPGQLPPQWQFSENSYPSTPRHRPRSFFPLASAGEDSDWS